MTTGKLVSDVMCEALEVFSHPAPPDRPRHVLHARGFDPIQAGETVATNESGNELREEAGIRFVGALLDANAVQAPHHPNLLRFLRKGTVSGVSYHPWFFCAFGRRFGIPDVVVALQVVNSVTK